jgi:3-methyl-2-oxobutanoate hydroxymethyltransferase
MVVQGHANALPVTLDEVIYHTRCVARGVRRALLVADTPFMTYQIGAEQALTNAGRLIQEGGAHAVKLEGGQRTAAVIAAITRVDIPVMAHIGLTPQSVHRFGGFRVQRDAERIVDDAVAVEQAGAFAVVLECIPVELAARVTARLSIPTIGIGAGAGCDGQILVVQDMLGMYDDLKPRFVKRFAEIGGQIRAATEDYCREVRKGAFPGPEHEFR